MIINLYTEHSINRYSDVENCHKFQTLVTPCAGVLYLLVCRYDAI